MSMKIKRGPRLRQHELLDHIPAENWRYFAACAGANGEIFFSEDLVANGCAQRLCNACPVIHQCREHADHTPERFGVWGGMTAEQRGWTTSGTRNRSRQSAA